MVAVGCLPDGKIVVWVQLILYFAAAFLGFFVTIPIGIVLRNFQGSCILFAQVINWRPAIIWPWSETSCDYVLYMNLAINIFYAFFIGCATLLIAYKCNKRYVHKIGKLHEWQIGYILTALNPVFLIVNSLIACLEVCGAAVVTAGTVEFCANTLSYLATNAMVTPTTTTLIPASAFTTTTQSSVCSIIMSTFDPTINDTVTYTVSAPCATSPLLSTTTMSVATAASCAQLQSWDTWWAAMRIIRGRDRGVYGANFFGCLVLACVASFLLAAVWLIQVALNILMMCRVCTCDIAEEKRKDDRTTQIAMRRSRLATPSVTPGGGAGRHTPSQQPLGPTQPSQTGAPRQYAIPEQQKALSRQEPYPEYGSKTVSPGRMTPPMKVPLDYDSDVTDRGAAAASPPPPQQQVVHMMPPPQRRMEPSPKRPTGAEGPVVTTSPDSSATSPPSYHPLPALQVRSPPSRLV
jgi:hypothetical protein